MKKAFVVLGILVGLLFVGSTKAETTPALVNDCKTFQRMDPIIIARGDTSGFTTDDWLSDGYCLGFLNGLADGAAGMEYDDGGTVYTVSVDEISARQLVAIFLKYVDEHPEILKESPTYAVSMSFIDGGVFKAKSAGTFTPNKKPTSVPAPLPDNRSKT